MIEEAEGRGRVCLGLVSVVKNLPPLYRALTDGAVKVVKKRWPAAQSRFIARVNDERAAVLSSLALLLFFGRSGPAGVVRWS